MISDLYDVSGKVAVVTGSSRGIGRSIALALAEGGADIVVNYVRSDKAAEGVKKDIEAMGRKAITVRGDVGNFLQAQAIAKAAMSHFGRIDILVNNAGVNRDRGFRRMTPEQWSEVIQTNLSSCFNCAKACVDPMIEAGGGTIISISSIIGEMGNIGQANYAATKAGIIGLTKTLAKELAPNNITVNCITPGFVETDMVAALPQDLKDTLIKDIPMGRFGTPDEIGLAALYLASPAGRWITGTALRINGGHYI